MSVGEAEYEAAMAIYAREQAVYRDRIGRLQERHGPMQFRLFGSRGLRGVFEDGAEVLIPEEPDAPYWPCATDPSHRADRPFAKCWRCAGDDALTPDQQRYLADVTAWARRGRHQGFPHCDEHILHAKETCAYCGMKEYRHLHTLRDQNHIGYTNQPIPEGWSPCPSEAYRSAEVRDRWSGNVEKRLT